MPTARGAAERRHRPGSPLWLICPYDADTLSPAVVEEAHRSHPVIVEAGTHRGSAHYAGRAHVDALFAAELSRPSGHSLERPDHR